MIKDRSAEHILPEVVGWQLTLLRNIDEVGIEASSEEIGCTKESITRFSRTQLKNIEQVQKNKHAGGYFDMEIYVRIIKL